MQINIKLNDVRESIGVNPSNVSFDTQNEKKGQIRITAIQTSGGYSAVDIVVSVEELKKVMAVLCD